MGASASSSNNCKPQSTVPIGKIRLCIAGYYGCPHTGRAWKLADHVAKAYPDLFESWFYWDSKGEYYHYIAATFDKVPFPLRLKGHGSSPIVWLEVATADTAAVVGGATSSSLLDCNAMDGGNCILEMIGGNAELQQWVKAHTAAAGAVASDGPITVAFPPQLTAEEKAARVAEGPAKRALYFKADDAQLAALCDGISLFGDLSRTYGPGTAAEH